MQGRLRRRIHLPTCCRMAPLSTSPWMVSLTLSRMLQVQMDDGMWAGVPRGRARPGRNAGPAACRSAAQAATLTCAALSTQTRHPPA